MIVNEMTSFIKTIILQNDRFEKDRLKKNELLKKR